MIKLNRDTENVLKYLIGLKNGTNKPITFRNETYKYEPIKKYADFVEHLKILDKYSYIKMDWEDIHKSNYYFKIHIEICQLGYEYFEFYKNAKSSKIDKFTSIGNFIATIISFIIGKLFG